MIGEFTNLVLELGKVVPLEIYVIIAGIVEEIVAPIPSPLILTTAGTLAKTQNYGIFGILFLTILASISKTIGTSIVYFISDQAENLLKSKFGKMLGIDTDSFQDYITKVQNKENIFLYIVVLRAIPIFPTAPVSLVAGFIDYDAKKYLASTFIGLLFRSIFYIAGGYIGFGLVSSNLEILTHLEDIIMKLSVVALAGIAGFMLHKFWKRRNSKNKMGS